jgi:hypothetical protein
MSGGEKRYLDAITKAAGFLMKMQDDQYGGYFNGSASVSNLAESIR